MVDVYNKAIMYRGFVAILMILSLLLVNTNPETLERNIPGDLMLGGMFPIHTNCKCNSNSPSQHCHQEPFPKGLFLAETMVYAVQQVNKQGVLPFNITLGLHVRDTCNALSNTVENALLFASERKKSTYEEFDNGKVDIKFKINKTSTVIGVVGAGRSDLSLAANHILSYYGIPQVAYASSAAFLNDKNRYPTFLRVLPPDTLQAKAIAQLMAHFKWNYISLVSSEGHYAGPLREAFREEARRLEICLSNDIVFSYTLPPIHAIQRRLQGIKRTNKSQVILLMASENIAMEIVKAAISINLTDRIWIASDSWSNALDRSLILKGGLGVFFKYRPVKDFVKYLNNRLKTSFKDSWLDALSKAAHQDGLHTKENPKNPDKRFDSALIRVDYVMNSVFILGHVIREFCLDLDMHLNATEEERKTKCLEKIYPRALLKYLFNRTIEGYSKEFTINRHGDPHGTYEFLNMQQRAGKLTYVNVGSYDSKTKILSLNDSLIDFGQEKGGVPESRCSSVCPYGYYVVRDPVSPCCWQCKICPSNHVSNITMATSCERCGDDYVSNGNKSRCEYVPLEYLRWTHPWSIFLCVFSLLCFAATILFIMVFVYHRHSPVVRASCFEISIALLISIAVGFLLPPLHFMKPLKDTCQTSAFLFAMVFTVILSLTLAKINRTVLILKNCGRDNGLFHKRFLLSSPAHFTSVVILTLIQMFICIAWLFKDSPEAKITKSSTPKFERYLHCTFHESSWLMVSHGFIIFLSLLCTLLAFQSRNFPENYNHAKFVSLAMFSFNMVWLSSIGAYYGNSQPGKHHTVIHTCAMIFSNLLLLFFIYGPKVYVIFFRPELNNARTFREMNLQHILGMSDSSRNFSLASVTTPGRGNVYLMDFDGNNKGVQTLHVPCREAQTQTEVEENKPIHKTSLVQRLLRLGSTQRKGRKKGVALFKRVYSESDAQKSIQLTAITPSVSSPQPLYACGVADKGDAMDDNYLGLLKIDENVTENTANSQACIVMTMGAQEELSSLIHENHTIFQPEDSDHTNSHSDNDEPDVFNRNCDDYS